MMLKSILTASFVTALALATAAPAMAQGIQIGPDGVQVLPDGRRGPPDFDRRDFRDGPPRRDRDRDGISEREAARIARSEGMREIDDVMRQRRTFRVEGADRRGRDMTVIIDRRSGDVINVR